VTPFWVKAMYAPARTTRTTNVPNRAGVGSAPAFARLFFIVSFSKAPWGIWFYSLQSMF